MQEEERADAKKRIKKPPLGVGLEEERADAKKRIKKPPMGVGLEDERADAKKGEKASYGSRTHYFAVKGQCVNRYTKKALKFIRSNRIRTRIF